MPHDLFLSYTRIDAIIMQRIRTELTAEGLSVWSDEGYLDHQIGTPYWEKDIENAIKDSSGLVVLLSRESNQSVWVAREISYAEALGIRIFPVLIRGDDITAIPIRLVNHQRINLRYPPSQHAAIVKLIMSICEYLGIQSLSQQRAEEAARAEAERRKQRRLEVKRRRQEQEEAERNAPGQIIQDRDDDVSDLAQDPVSVEPHPRQLRAINPGDWFVLLWWLLVQPGTYKVYRDRANEGSFRAVGTWLGSTLAFTVVLIHLPAIGYSDYTKWLPIVLIGWLMASIVASQIKSRNSVIRWAAYIVVGGTGLVLGTTIGIATTIDARGIGAAASITATALTWGIANCVAGGTSIVVAEFAGGLAWGTMWSAIDTVIVGVPSKVSDDTAGWIIIAAFIGAFVALWGVAAFIKRSLVWNSSSRRGIFMLVLLALSYGTLIWLYLLGAWYRFYY